MFEITAADIEALEDDDLRTLIGRLYEAELEKHALSTSAVTWSGKQTAKDGGIDVKIDLPKKAKVRGYILRPIMGIQVKKPKMTVADITNEMRPPLKGKKQQPANKPELRPSIVKLINDNGAYIMVSSGSDVSDTELQLRRDAMKEAIKDVSGAEGLAIDFYDAGRVATWLRTHPALIPFVREKINKPLSGWQSYGSWANPSEDINADYYTDEKPRVFKPGSETTNPISNTDAINEMRQTLSQPRTVVRIVGLSGVGKTRFVQALFDKKVGFKPLSKSQVFYADYSQSPNPTPAQLISSLKANGKKAVVIVDNCGPETHAELVKVCNTPDSKVSLVTIEYDIRDDLPEETHVYKLEPASQTIIEKLLEDRFPDLSQVNISSIAKFAGGNARIAIALASRVKSGENLSKLKNAQLFQKLFEQNNGPDKGLLESAEVLSLVYSFNGDDIDSSDSELLLLGGFINKKPEELYKDIQELKRRGLLQERSKWRAILPHAIANWLASRALENIPSKRIEAVLINGPKRIVKSLTRRLSFLHDDPKAVAFAKSMLNQGGLLHEVQSLNEEERELLKNIATLCPEEVLQRIEEALSTLNPDKLKWMVKYAQLLRHIAYDPKLFQRCVRALIAIMQIPYLDFGNTDAPASIIKSLFPIHLSGTHATLEQRLQILEEMLDSNVEAIKELGYECLDQMLECWHFSSSYAFEFGALNRDFGYSPKAGETKKWFVELLNFTTQRALKPDEVGRRYRKILAQSIRGLITRVGLIDEVSKALKLVASKMNWKEAWIAVRQTGRMDIDHYPEPLAKKLKELEKALRPVKLPDQVRAFAIEGDIQSYDIDGFDDDIEEDIHESISKGEMQALRLGEQLAKDETSLQELMPEMLRRQGSRSYMLGNGLAKGAENAALLWNRLITVLETIPENEQEVNVLRGYLAHVAKDDPNLANKMVQDIAVNPKLKSLYPYFQSAVTISSASVDLIIKSLNEGVAKISAYKNFAWGRVMDEVPEVDMQRLIYTLIEKPDGEFVAAEILSMRIYAENQCGNSAEQLPILAETGRHILANWPTEKLRDDSQAYRLAEIARFCLVGATGEPQAKQLMNRIKVAISTYMLNAWDISYLMEALFEAYPMLALTVFLEEPFEGEYSSNSQFFRDARVGSRNMIGSITSEQFLAWAGQNPETRFPMIAHIVPLWGNGSGPEGWTDIAIQVAQNAPDQVSVVSAYMMRLWPSSWSGSRVPLMEARLANLIKLKEVLNDEAKEFIDSSLAELKARIDYEREREQERSRDEDESFE